MTFVTSIPCQFDFLLGQAPVQTVINPFGIGLMALVVLGGLAVFGYLIARAVFARHPAAMTALVYLPLGLIVGVVMFLALGFIYAVSQQPWHETSATHYVAQLVGAPVDSDGTATMSTDPLRGSVRVGILKWTILVGLGVALLLLVGHSWKSHHQGERRGGRLAENLFVALLVLVIVTVATWDSPSSEDVAHHRDEIRGRVGSIRMEARKEIEEAKEEGKQTMQELWEDLNEPRIELEKDHADTRDETSEETTSDHGESDSDHGEAALAAGDNTTEGAPNPRPRPVWVDQPPKRVGNVWREVVFAGDYATIRECNLAADVELLEAVRVHIAELVGAHGGNRSPVVPQLDQMGIGIDYIRREIAKDEYLETVERSVGPMVRSYTLLEFSSSVDRDLRNRWETFLRESRLLTVGGVGALAFSLVGLAYGLLKVDTWTKGYYTKQLILGVPAAIIAGVALAAAFIAF
jgi:hypothetical protein